VWQNKTFLKELITNVFTGETALVENNTAQFIMSVCFDSSYEEGYEDYRVFEGTLTTYYIEKGFWRVQKVAIEKHFYGALLYDINTGERVGGILADIGFRQNFFITTNRFAIASLFEKIEIDDNINKELLSCGL
jgi:hypothetical protein